MSKLKPLPYIITFAVGLALSAAVFLIVVFADSNARFDDITAVLGVLSDAFAVSGIMLFGIGGIAFAERKGTFDALGYSVESVLVVRNLSPKRRFKERENFADYKERKAVERKKKSGIAHYFIVGAFFIVVAVVLVVIYTAIR